MKILLVTVLALIAAPWLRAQSAQPGLWEATVKMKMSGVTPQIPPDVLEKMKAQGIKPPPMLTGEPMVEKVCETEDIIKKFGVPEPQAQHDCAFNVLQRSSSGFSGEMVCHGNVNGRGTVKAILIDSTHATAHIEFTGTGQKGQPISFTVDNSSHFISASCGDVQPGHPAMQ